MKPSLERELRLYDALKRITAYMTPPQLRKFSQKKYGLEPEEAIEMAYENVLLEAANALRGMRRPVATDPATKAGTTTATGE